MLRQRRGMTLEVLAGLCGMSTAYLSMIENGKRGFDPRYSMILTLASALRVMPGDLAPGMPSDSAESFRPTVAGQHPDRSETAEDVIDVLRRVRDHDRSVDPEVILLLQENMQYYVTGYETLDHASIAAVLVKQRAWTEALVSKCHHGPQRRNLHEVAAGTCGLLGYIAVGRGDFPLARAYCLEAFQLGELARRPDLQAWARGTQSFCEYYAGRYDKAQLLAQDGLRYAGSGPQSVRLAVNGAARALGKLGDAQGVQRAVDQAYELMAQNTVPSGVPSSISFGCYSAAQTASNAATAWLSLGRPDKVQDYINLALPDISKSPSPWSRSLVMIDLALSLIQPKDADLDHAAELVTEALSISAGRPVVSVQLRASEFARAAATRWSNAGQLSTVREAISSLKPVDDQSK
jgi:transcriptional regulator with XRE-family HTH domain